MRNFGLSFEKITTGPATRAADEQLGRSIASGAQRESIRITNLPDCAGSKDSYRQLFLGDEKELGEVCLVVALSFLPVLIIFACSFFLLALMGN